MTREAAKVLATSLGLLFLLAAFSTPAPSTPVLGLYYPEFCGSQNQSGLAVAALMAATVAIMQTVGGRELGPEGDADERR